MITAQAAPAVMGSGDSKGFSGGDNCGDNRWDKPASRADIQLRTGAINGAAPNPTLRTAKAR